MNDAWSTEWQEEIEALAAAEIEEAVTAAEAVEPLSAGEIFDAMYAEATPVLERHRRESMDSGP